MKGISIFSGCLFNTFYRTIRSGAILVNLIMIIFGGAIGALLRYLVSGAVHKYLDTAFPIGTLVVNMTGCLFIGFLTQLFENFIVSSTFRNFLLIGVLGAFTTFSTFGFESLSMIRDGEIKYAFLNISISVIIGLVFVFAGIILARLSVNVFK